VPISAVPPSLIGGRRIKRQDLRGLADAVVKDVGDQHLIALIITVQAWGSGIAGQGGDGRGPWRAAGALGLPDRRPDSQPGAGRLAAARTAVHLSRRDVAGAWRHLKRGPGHLPRWDEAFYTKLMAAAGYEHSPQPWPLILDGRVRAALKALKEPVKGYGRGDYLAYLEWAQCWADRWQVSPEQVEFALFKHAGTGQ
jgi:8-oxoguanine DNA glycosylase-like protein